VLKTALSRLFGIKYPIIQGGMAHLGTAELVSAVANAGGLGFISAGYYESEWVKQQIELTRQKTSRPFGVNIPLASPHVNPVVDVVLGEKVSVVATGAGNPEEYIPRFKQAGIRVMPVVASVAAAKRAEQNGADAVVAEGMESAGHIGETTTMVLLPQVVDSVGIPVVAAGGIADGRGLAAALVLGAQGIQMGTRFALSTECIAHPGYKQKILEAGEQATTVTRQASGLPLRSLTNALTEQFQALRKAALSQKELELFDQGRMYLGLIEGNTEQGWLIAGQIAGMLKEIRPVKEIIEDIVTQAEAILNRLNNRESED